MDTVSLYDRQKTLKLKPVGRVTVVGLGGTGSWVTLLLAMTGKVREIVTIDFDKVEKHNLNRTLFKQYHIGLEKTFALQDLINERREDANVIFCNQNVKELDSDTKRKVANSAYIIDCTDNIRIRDYIKETFKKPKLIRLGYDGWNVTFDSKATEVWGEGDSGYRIVPSFVLPPVFATLMVISYLFGDKKDTFISLDTSKLLKKLG